MSKSSVGCTLAFQLTKTQLEYVKTNLPKLFSLQPVSKILRKPDLRKEISPVLKNLDDYQMDDFIKLQNIPDASPETHNATPNVRPSDLRTINSRPTTLVQVQVPKPPQVIPEPMAEEIPPKPLCSCRLDKICPPKQQQPNKGYLEILQELRKNSFPFVFPKPLSPTQLQILGQNLFQKKQMDIETVEVKINQCTYKHEDQLHQDILLIWLNSYSFPKRVYQSPTASINTQSEEIIKNTNMASNNNKLKRSKPLTVKAKTEQRTATKQERFKLCQEIRSLDPRYLTGVWDIVAPEDQTDIIFDLEVLQEGKVRALRRLLDDIYRIQSSENRKEKVDDGQTR